jgi:hypothetical protein
MSQEYSFRDFVDTEVCGRLVEAIDGSPNNPWTKSGRSWNMLWAESTLAMVELLNNAGSTKKWKSHVLFGPAGN